MAEARVRELESLVDEHRKQLGQMQLEEIGIREKRFD